MTEQSVITLKGHLSPADRTSNHFHLLPFQVPEGTHRLEVHFRFSDRLAADEVGWREGNILDIGLFDSRGADFLTGAGFRGWSGSKLDQFFIEAGEATPGYLPGPVVPGQWKVALGLYQIASHGCEFEVEVVLVPGDPGESPVTSATPPFASEIAPRWYRGDFHAHTWHSDGSAPLADLVAAARAQGLDFITVTEHNTTSHLDEVLRQRDAGITLIPGVEISTYRGHANVWPVDSFVEFRCQTDEQMAAVREWVRDSGAIFSVNHPKDGGPPWEFGEFFRPDCVEVWGGPWFISNHQSLAAWDELLRSGQRVTAIGGSDKHVGPYSGESLWYDVGTPCTWVHADACTPAGIRDAVRRGQVFISATPEGPRIDLVALGAGAQRPPVVAGGEVGADEAGTIRLQCRVRGAAGNVLRLVSRGTVIETEVEVADYFGEWVVRAEPGDYWRAEVIEPPEIPLDQEPAALMALAFSNPIYVVAG